MCGGAGGVFEAKGSVVRYHLRSANTVKRSKFTVSLLDLIIVSFETGHSYMLFYHVYLKDLRYFNAHERREIIWRALVTAIVLPFGAGLITSLELVKCRNIKPLVTLLIHLCNFFCIIFVIGGCLCPFGLVGLCIVHRWVIWIETKQMSA